MQIYNCDETGISVVHKPGKVVVEMGCYKVSITSAERGKTHTVLICVSAAGNVLPPIMIFPSKKTSPDRFHEGSVAQTLLCSSLNGWINDDLGLSSFSHALHHLGQSY